MRLLKILGVTFGLAVAIGNTIGAGILAEPGHVATLLRTPTLFVGVWVIGALYALLGVNALAELGTMLPRAGAQYVSARHAFGDYAGFLVGWLDWISTCASTAAISFVIGQSIEALIPTLSAKPLAMATVVVFTLLLLRSTRVGGRSQIVTSLFKTVALGVFIAICFVFGGHATGPVTNAATAATGAPTSFFVGFVLSVQAVIYTYDGWSGPVYFSEELRDPGRQIPRSMFGALLAVAAIYLLINLAFLHVLPLSAMAGSQLAAADVAQAIFGPRGQTVVHLVVILALPSAVNACLLMSSRVLFAVSRDGIGPRFATRVNEGGSPTVALIGSGIVSLTFLATGTFNSVIAVAAFFFVADYALSFLAVFVLRQREPNRPRPYRALGHPWTTGLVLVGSIAFLLSAVAGDTKNSLWALGILVISYPAFILTHRRRPVVEGIEGEMSEALTPESPSPSP